MRRCMTRWTSPDSSQTRYLPRRSSPRPAGPEWRRRPPTVARAHTSAGRAPSPPRAAGPRPPARAGGESSRPRAVPAWREATPPRPLPQSSPPHERRRRELRALARQPQQDARADVRQQPVHPPPVLALEHGKKGGEFARVVGSRVGGVAAAGGRSAPASRPGAAPPASARRRRRSSEARCGSRPCPCGGRRPGLCRSGS